MSGQPTPNLPPARVPGSPRLRSEETVLEHDSGKGCEKGRIRSTRHADRTSVYCREGTYRNDQGVVGRGGKKDVVGLDVRDSPRVTGATLLQGPIHHDQYS